MMKLCVHANKIVPDTLSFFTKEISPRDSPPTPPKKTHSEVKPIRE